MRQRLIALVMSSLAVAMAAASLAGFQGRAALQPTSAVTIRAETLLDGRGGVAKDVVIRIENGRIASVGRSAERVRYSLPGATVMPGWIDTHVHPDSHFNKDGRADNRGETPVTGSVVLDGERLADAAGRIHDSAKPWRPQRRRPADRDRARPPARAPSAHLGPANWAQWNVRRGS